MSRSNGPKVPTNGWPQGYPPDPNDPYAQSYPHSQPHQNAGHQPQPGYPPAQQPAYPQQTHQATVGRPARIQQPPQRSPQVGIPPNGPAGLQDPYGGQTYPGQTYVPGPAPQAPQQGYGQPQQGPGYGGQPASNGYGASPTGNPAANSYGTSYGAPAAYVPPAAPSAPPQADPRYGAYSGYDTPPTGRPTAPPPAGYGQMAPPPSPPTTRPQSRYDQAGWPPQGPSGLQPDPRGYDLGAYSPSPEPQTQRPTAPPAWVPADVPTTGRPSMRQQEPSYEPGFGNSNGHGNGYAQQMPQPLPPSQAVEPVQDDFDDEVEDYEPRRPRYGLIAASLIVAIAAGGGLAYAYKSMFAPPAKIAGTPVIKSGSQPVKVKPTDPGGAKFANADSKMMDQLAGSAPSDGPKPVKSITVGRDGSIVAEQASITVNPPPAAPQQSQSALAAASQSSTASPIPGMTVVLPQARPAPPPPVAAAPLPAAAPPQATVPAKPKVVAAAQPVEAGAEAAPKKPVVPRKPVTPPAGVGAAGAAVGASGYVAVLASVPASGSSRVLALQQFADMQQKYGGVLAGKAPEVVEAQLEKGTFHRLVVGPPASKEAANGVCSQLKAAGYTQSCWVTTF